MSPKVTIEVDTGDAIATYGFLRQSVQRLLEITQDMPEEA